MWPFFIDVRSPSYSNTMWEECTSKTLSVVLIFHIKLAAGIYCNYPAVCWQSMLSCKCCPLFSPTRLGLLGLGRKMILHSLISSNITQWQLLASWETFMLFTANNIKVVTAMNNAQERQKAASHSLTQLHCEKTSQIAQFRDRFSDFVSHFLPFVVLSWSLNNARNLFLFILLPLLEKHEECMCVGVGKWFKVFGVISETKVKLVLLC